MSEARQDIFHRTADRAFWLAVRQALLAFVVAIEARHLPDLRKQHGQRPQDSV